MVFNWFLPFRDEYLSQFDGREDRHLYVDDIFQQLTEVRKANWNFLYTCIKNFYCLSAVRDILCDCSLLFLLPVGRNYGRTWRCEKRYRRKSKAWVNMLLLTEWAFKMSFILRYCKNILGIHCPESVSKDNILHFFLLRITLICDVFSRINYHYFYFHWLISNLTF